MQYIFNRIMQVITTVYYLEQVQKDYLFVVYRVAILKHQYAILVRSLVQMQYFTIIDLLLQVKYYAYYNALHSEWIFTSIKLYLL